MRYTTKSLVDAIILALALHHFSLVLVQVPSPVVSFSLLLKNIQTLQVLNAFIICLMGNHVVVLGHSSSEGWWLQRLLSHYDLSFKGIGTAPLSLFMLGIIELLLHRIEAIFT